MGCLLPHVLALFQNQTLRFSSCDHGTAAQAAVLSFSGDTQRRRRLRRLSREAHATTMWGFSGIWRLQQPLVAMWRRQQSSTAAVVLWRKNDDEKLMVLLLRRDQIYFNPIDLRCSLI
ncbi:hypothetical protein AAC387_Pa01g0652 [Persea americana]